MYDNLSWDESIELLKEQHPDDSLVQHIYKLHDEDTCSVSIDYSYEVEKYKSQLQLIMGTIVQTMFHMHYHYKKTTTCRQMRDLIHTVWVFVNSNLTDNVATEEDSREQQDISKFYDIVCSILPHTHDKPDMNYFISLIEKNDYVIEIPPNQSYESYVDISSAFRYVYELIRGNERIGRMINAIEGVIRIFEGNVYGLGEYLRDVVEDEFFNNILKTHTNILQQILDNKKTIKIPMLQISTKCDYSPYDEKDDEIESIIELSYKVIKNVILNPDTFRESNLLRELIESIINWKNIVKT